MLFCLPRPFAQLIEHLLRSCAAAICSLLWALQVHGWLRLQRPEVEAPFAFCKDQGVRGAPHGNDIALKGDPSICSGTLFPDLSDLSSLVDVLIVESGVCF